MSRLVVRDARDTDAAGLITLIGECFAAYTGCVLDVDGELPDLRRFGSAFAELGGRAWVAQDELGRIVGSVAYTPTADGPAVELHRLYVSPRARRRGLGAQLCELVEAAGRDSDAKYVELWSDTRFIEAHKLYERLGYERDGRTRELHDLSESVEFYYRKPIE